MNQKCSSCGYITTASDNRRSVPNLRICPNCNSCFETTPNVPIFQELEKRMSMNNFGRNSGRYMEIKTLAWIKELCNIIEEKFKEMK